MVSLPTPPIASRAFTARLARIWSSCAGSIFTFHRSRPGIHARSMSSPISRWIIFCVPATASFRSSTFGLTVCLRAKASSCPVISAERCAARRISMQVLVQRLPGLHLRQRHLHVADDHLQHVVEVVRHPAGKLPHRLHLLRLAQLILQLSFIRGQSGVFGDVLEKADDPAMLRSALPTA